MRDLHTRARARDQRARSGANDRKGVKNAPSSPKAREAPNKGRLADDVRAPFGEAGLPVNAVDERALSGSANAAWCSPLAKKVAFVRSPMSTASRALRPAVRNSPPSSSRGGVGSATRLARRVGRWHSRLAGFRHAAASMNRRGSSLPTCLHRLA